MSPTAISNLTFILRSRSGPLPIILWSRGSKEQPPLVNIMARVFIVVSLNYRLSGDAPFPAAIEDCKAAIRWLRANAAPYDVDPDHIGI
jgi:acetyl esterase/lipase